MKTWNVICEGRHIGVVQEVDEANAGSEALSCFGVDQEEWDRMTVMQQQAALARVIPPGAGIEVVPA